MEECKALTICDMQKQGELIIGEVNPFMLNILETLDLKLNLCKICPTQSAAIFFTVHLARIIENSD